MVTRALKHMAAALVVLGAGGVATTARAQTWEPFCKEGETCAFEGTRILRYGSGDKFNYGIATSVVRCSYQTFGDPAPDTDKRCFAYYTADEMKARASLKAKDQRIARLKEAVDAAESELDQANAEIDQLHRELRRERRRDERVEERRRSRREMLLGPIIIERQRP